VLHTDGQSYHVVTDAWVLVVMVCGGIEEGENERMRSGEGGINDINQKVKKRQGEGEGDQKDYRMRDCEVE
jgi:hypothetical protein